MNTNVEKFECKWCAKTKAIDEKHALECTEDYICDACFDNSFVCGNCDERRHVDDSMTITSSRHGLEICDACFENGDYGQCDDCNELLHLDDIGSNGRCNNCDDADGDEIPTRDIDLETKEFQDDKAGKYITSKRTFGVELEMLSKDSGDLRKLADTLDDKVGVSGDGSIEGGYGIEIQTPILKGKKGEDTLIKIVNKSKECGLGVNNTCGTHIHLGAEDFVPTYKAHKISCLNACTGNHKLIGYIIKDDDEYNKTISKLIGTNYSFSLQGIEYTRAKINGVVAEIKLAKQKTIKITNLAEIANSRPGTLSMENLEWCVSEMILRRGYGDMDNGGKYKGFRGEKNCYLVIMDNNSHTSSIEISDYCKNTENYLSSKNFLGFYNSSVLLKDTLSITKNLFRFYVAFDDVILGMLPDNRRTNRYCEPIKNLYAIGALNRVDDFEDFDKMWYGASGGIELKDIISRKGNTHDNSRYVGINFHSMLCKNGTLEIRYHAGTLDADKILSWISLHQAIMDRIATGKISTVSLLSLPQYLRFEQKQKKFLELLDLPKELQAYVEGRIKLYNK